VATHGLALNVASSPLLAWFRLIDPCGLGEEVEVISADDDDPDDDGVTTSLWRELRRGGGGEGEAAATVAAAPTVRAVAANVAHALAGALGVRAVWPQEPQEVVAGRLQPLPPEAARAVLEGVAITAAALERRAPQVPPRPP
jgi:hypothetical protein